MVWVVSPYHLTHQNVSNAFSEPQTGDRVSDRSVPSFLLTFHSKWSPGFYSCPAHPSLYSSLLISRQPSLSSFAHFHPPQFRFNRQVPLRSVRASAHLSLRLSQPHSTLTSALPHLNSPNNPYSYYVCITTTVVECRLHWGCNTPLIRLSNAHCALISSLMNYYNSLSNTYYNDYYTL